MNFPAASRGVSMYDKFNPNAASCGGLTPADFAISNPTFIIIYVICEICGLKDQINIERKEIEMKKGKRDIETSYPVKQFVQKLRRLADAIENGKRFQIQIAERGFLFPPMPYLTSSMRGASKMRKLNSN